MKSLSVSILESLENEDVNIILGRFQPFTLGHLKCAEYADKVAGVRTVICMIETNKADVKHPFISKVLLPIYTKMVHALSTLFVPNVFLFKSADIVEITNTLNKNGYTVKYWSCGTDRYDNYVKMTKKYAPEIEVLEIPRSSKDISATAVRNALKDDDKKSFYDMTPSTLHSEYNILKELIDSLK